MESINKIPNALENINEIHTHTVGKSVIFFLDYDGTLTPIVSRPDLAVLSEDTRQLLIALSKKYTVALFSGRDLANIRQMVGLPNIYYAGSHGFEIGTIDNKIFENEEAQRLVNEIDDVERILHTLLKRTDGALIERKRFSIAAHYRMVAPEKRDTIKQAVDKALAQHPHLRIRMGKMVYEIEPDLNWNKGFAVEWLLKSLGMDDNNALPIYLGDDVTDEDAFKALAGRGVCIAIQEFPKPTMAQYTLEGPVEVHEFLRSFLHQ